MLGLLVGAPHSFFLQLVVRVLALLALTSELGTLPLEVEILAARRPFSSSLFRAIDRIALFEASPLGRSKATLVVGELRVELGPAVVTAVDVDLEILDLDSAGDLDRRGALRCAPLTVAVRFVRGEWCSLQPCRFGFPNCANSLERVFVGNLGVR